MYGTRLLIVEYHGDFSLFRSGIDIAPLGDLTVEDTPYVGNGDAGVGVLLVLDERQSVEGQYHGQRCESSVDEALALLLLKVARRDHEVDLAFQQLGNALRLAGVDGFEFGIAFTLYFLEDFSFFFDNGTKTFVRGETNHP